MIRRFEAGSTELVEFLNNSEEDLETLSDQVMDIGRQVREKGDQALIDFSARFDGARLDSQDLRVSEAEIERACAEVEPEYLASLETAIKNITDFHRKQLQNSWIETDSDGVILGQIQHALEKVGIYVPGGTAAYPSSVLMNAIPAQVAGVPEIIMVTPPSVRGEVNPYTLAAASQLGIRKIFKVGGAQAIFALAYGTQSIPKVDKITGPGNIFVTLAKKMVYGQVDIDMLAGPSEILIVADEKADPKYLAADLMSQAEHDVRARSILVATSAQVLDQVEQELQRQMATLSRRDIIKESLSQRGALVLVENLFQAFALANQVAPEHLEVMVEEPFAWLGYIENAGAIFLGPYAPEPIGDYLAGPNHILPTGGTARFYSPVTVETFIKKSSLIYYTRKGFERCQNDIIRLATVEGLTAHANSIRVRKE